MLDQETIRTFIQVATLCSFSKAASVLHKTPAAISYRIKTLESDLGVELFKRTTRTVTLTIAGTHLFARCQQWMRWLDTMPAELKQISDGVEPQVNIVINNLLYNENATAELLAHLKKLFPFTQFKIQRHVYMGVWDTLLHGGIQLAIGASGWESLDNAVHILPLGRVNWDFVVASHHPLTELREKLSDEQLRSYPAINVEDTSQTLTKRVAWLLPGQTEIKVPNLKTKLACHLKGLGVGFMPKNISQVYIDRGELIKCHVANPRKPSPLSLAWRPEGIGKATQEIIQLFHRKHPIVKGFLNVIDEPYRFERTH